MRLYWVTTPDGYENWFVVAKSKKLAQIYHEDSEGFNRNYSNAELVCTIHPTLVLKFNLDDPNGSWPSHELLLALGCVIETECNPRVVNFKGKVFVEGDFVSKICLEDIRKVSGVYVIKIQNTEKYKIGITTNLSQRIKQLSTGNPYNIKPIFFVKTEHYKSLEKHLHDTYKENRVKGEWFIFNEERLKDLETGLYFLQFNAPKHFEVHNMKSVAIQGGTY